MVLITSTLWWGKLSNPWSFVIFGALALCGIHSLYAVAEGAWSLFGASGSFLEVNSQVTPESIERAKSALTIKAISASIVVLVVGSPLLFWLRALLTKA